MTEGKIVSWVQNLAWEKKLWKKASFGSLSRSIKADINIESFL